MEGKDGRTERATAKKRSKERQDGNLCVSPEVVSLTVLFLGVISLRLACPMIWQKLSMLLMNAFRFEYIGDWNAENANAWFCKGYILIGILLAPVLAPVMLGAIVSNMAQTGPYFSTKAMKWKFSTLNPVKGIKKLFSMQSIVKLSLSLLKVALIVFTVYFLIRKQVSVLMSLQDMSSAGTLQWIFLLIFRMSMIVVSIFVVLAAFDWIYKKYKYEQGLMMTKKEVKDEKKQEEISPLVKRLQYKKMREFTLMRMMAAVPNANVVITNPTYVAVAIEYDPEHMDAPKVTAKGLRLVAERIKRIAQEHNIPIVERPDTARSLYKYVKVGNFIPSYFYEAVAEVLAYLHKIGRGIKMAG